MSVCRLKIWSTCCCTRSFRTVTALSGQTASFRSTAPLCHRLVLLAMTKSGTGPRSQVCVIVGVCTKNIRQTKTVNLKGACVYFM